MSDEEKTEETPITDRPDPWPPAQEALFDIIRAWVSEDYKDHKDTAARCLEIMEEVNKTPHAPFIFIAELARVTATCIARYMAALNEELPSRAEVMAEIDALEMDYIEESVMAEQEDEQESEQADLSRRSHEGIPSAQLP